MQLHDSKGYYVSHGNSPPRTPVSAHLNITSIYTPLEDAYAEIQRRWKDKTLEDRIHDFLGNDIPYVFRQQPVAVSTAHVATPNFSFAIFHKMSRSVDLIPVAFEYLDDLFITTNYDKAALAKMRFLVEGNGSACTWKSRKIIDMSGKEEKRRLSALRTLWDESFVEFHHRLLLSTMPDIILHDGSSWYARNGMNPSERYLATMALFVRNSILIETFLTTEAERTFTQSVVLPAFQEIYRRFGHKPLIVALESHDDEKARFWWSYPSKMETLLPSSGVRRLVHSEQLCT